VGQEALTRFFVLHVVALPAAGSVLLVLHLFRLRRAGGLARPPEAAGPGEALVPARGLLTEREVALALAVCLVLVALAATCDARLGPPPDLLRPDNPPKAPWFLVGLQELVAYSALVGGVVFPSLLLLSLAAAPWVDGRTTNDGAPLRGRGARLAIPLSVLVAATAAAAAIVWWGDPQHGRAGWLNPATIVTGVVIAMTLVVVGVARSRPLAFQSWLAGLLAALVVFTVVGWVWRGPDWRLAYHPGPGHGAAAPARRRAEPPLARGERGRAEPRPASDDPRRAP
jgi:quinol-cytochrome oxidoreductase complex cytochrome b subunit